MSVLVVSDTHGQVSALAAVLEWAKTPDAGQNGNVPFTGAVFLGDGTDDPVNASAASGFTVPWYFVRGNCDMDFSIPETQLVKTGGRTLFLAHGNRFMENGTVAAGALAAAARSSGAEAALFGHTHVPWSAVYGGIFLLNPGSLGRPRTRTGATFAVLDYPAEINSRAAEPRGSKPSPRINPPYNRAGPFAARFFGLAQQGRAFAVQEIPPETSGG